MTQKVRIIGAGLSGVIAALEAHRLGCRDIEIHERYAGLGGQGLPEFAHGLELRHERLYFGPRGEAVRSLLEDAGLCFEDIEARCGSVSPGRACDLVTHDFSGPAILTHALEVSEVAGPSLTDRLHAYPADIAKPLLAYCRWRLGASLEGLDAGAAQPLGIERVFPRGSCTSELAHLKAADARYDKLYAQPGTLWETPAPAASLPRDGFVPFFLAARRVLDDLGVKIFEQSLVSPRAALAEHQPGELMVWAAGARDLYKPMGLKAPDHAPRAFATYVFRARYSGPLPFFVHNFTAKGAVFRIYLYLSGGQVMLTAECVEEWPDDALRREIYRLMEGFGGASLNVGELAAHSVRPRGAFHTRASIEGLAALRGACEAKMGAGFVAGAWEAGSPGATYAEISAGLQRALGVEERLTAAA